MAQTVVLLHQQPGKPDHYDWLIDQPQLKTEHRLLTFRVTNRPDQQRVFQAEKAPDHRAFYLNYEGPLTDRRGCVTRVLRGEVRDLEVNPNQVSCLVKWATVWLRIEALCTAPETQSWRIEATPTNQA